MQFSNYPAGVSDAHPHFNPPEEMQVICGSEESTVIPSFELKAEMKRLIASVTHLQSVPTSVAIAAIPALEQSLTNLLDRVEELEDNGSYACPFEGEVQPELDGGAANWDCPVCGETNQTILEDDDEPDYDAMRKDARYDD